MAVDKRAKGLGLYAGCLAMGIATLKVASNDVAWLGYSLATLGGVTTVLDIVRNSNPYRSLFENLNLGIDGQIPRLVKKRKTNYGYCLTFSLPYGMSTDDFRKNQLAIEQYLNKKIEITYGNYRVFVKVFEKELEKSPEYRFIETKGKVEFPIGVIFGGKIITLDLEKVVHLLIAGETGSGKSTLLRVILTSIILSGKKISLHLIDLKNGAEFNVFRRCSQVRTFSRTKEEAEEVLSQLLAEVDRRYDLFFENDVVDIREYNGLKGVRKLDYKVVAIDEYADLQGEKKSTSAVETLAAKARACGIHLIISTQRPSANIINGTIKANIPCVIGLKTMNSLNSRIIIDQDGLENLKGKGHGLLKHSDVEEFQGMYLSTTETRDLIKDTYIEKMINIKHEEKVEAIEDFDFLKKLG